MSVETERLTLLPCAPVHLVTLIEQPEQFEHVAGLRLAEGLHAFFVSDDVSPEWLAALRRASDTDPWRFGFFVFHRGNGLVVGSGGFKGPPDTDGKVEIAYGIVPQYQGQGYATEVAMALAKFASDSGRVRLVLAHTLPHSNASTRVLEKCGFSCTGTVIDPDDGEVWRW